jgi:hypothetical protein
LQAATSPERGTGTVCESGATETLTVPVYDRPPPGVVVAGTVTVPTETGIRADVGET